MSDRWAEWLVVAAILIVAFLFARAVTRFVSTRMHTVTIFEYEMALKFTNGRYKGLVGPGRYRFFGTGTILEQHDTRPQAFHLPGQEIITADRITIKISVTGRYSVSDVEAAYLKTAAVYLDVYEAMQVALREAVAERTLDDILADRGALAAAVKKSVEPEFAARGAALDDIAVLDIMLPAAIKRAFSGAFEARKEGEAALERARGEQAVLRKLANLADMFEAHPHLRDARLIQLLSAGEGEHSIVFDTSADGGKGPDGNKGGKSAAKK